MRAIILAAGMGKRLGELTKGHTKCMIEVGGGVSEGWKVESRK